MSLFNLKGDLKNQFAVVSIMWLLWFNSILGLNFTFFCFKLINIHYHTLKQKKLKSQPRIKLIEPQHSLYDEENINFTIQRYKFWSLKASLSNSWICDYNIKCFHTQVQVTSSAHYKFTHSFFCCGSILSLV